MHWCVAQFYYINLHIINRSKCSIYQIDPVVHHIRSRCLSDTVSTK